MNKQIKITVLECTEINVTHHKKPLRAYLLFYKDKKVKTNHFQSASYDPQKEKFSDYFKAFSRLIDLGNLTEKEEYLVSNYIAIFKKENPDFHYVKNVRDVAYLMEVKGNKI